MNWAHLKAFLWLRWRLSANQWRRAGAFSAALMIFVAISIVTTAIPVFFGTVGLGIYAIPRATPDQLMYVWDGLMIAFLFFWGIGVITELQRNDPLSLSKFLHLPVSVNSAFLINYLSSLLKLSLITFIPVMAGYAVALVVVQGLQQWLILPLLGAFLLMVTAPTYQFQGWLASLVSNPRRRRTVMVGVTMMFVLVFQLPNLLNLYIPRMAQEKTERTASRTSEMKKLQEDFQAGRISNDAYLPQQEEMTRRHAAERANDSVAQSKDLARMARIANLAIPFGWLPLAVSSATRGNQVPGILGFFGMMVIGSLSLWRAYRTSVGQFQGQSSSRKGRVPVARPARERARGKMLIERNLPGVSEPVSAVALGGLQSMLRSPETKMALLTPLIMGGVFGSILYNARNALPESVRPLLGIAAIGFVLFGLFQIMSNQFGMDRDGFRVFLLSATPRREILLGKNLSFIPPALLLSILLLIVVEVLCPMRLDHLLSMIPQFISMYLVFCFVANVGSIYVPVYMNPGTLKPANPKFTTVMLQVGLFLILFPIFQAVTLIPLGVEALLNRFGVAGGWPICLLLCLAETVVILPLYRISLGWLGGRFQAREQRILETVTNRSL